MLKPGDCISLFAPKENNTHFTNSLAIKWRWQMQGGFDFNINMLISDSEIKEAFLTCLDIADKIFPSYPKGIRLHQEDRFFLEKNNLSIGGGSLGLSFLYGLFSYVRQRRPSKIIAWGAIHPTRNNYFAIYPTDASVLKMEIAAKLGANYVLHPESEPVAPYPGINEIKFIGSLKEAIVQLNTDSFYIKEP